jgi:hypothetical protein
MIFDELPMVFVLGIVAGTIVGGMTLVAFALVLTR